MVPFGAFLSRHRTGIKVPPFATDVLAGIGQGAQPRFKEIHGIAVPAEFDRFGIVAGSLSDLVSAVAEAKAVAPGTPRARFTVLTL